nr:immunoglobulin light chain junction region [Mus musculus]NSL97103.1 immunoglobulin light chain junction region [Mus musculus]NSL97108.1 immunoglobulin light chain junction region [Mus musculus]NSL97132.1 immunoglobulin light chain junction region [Mus musculus]NSL97153.1 immunoglobulin light chain junction region [Mus musculus]
CQQNNEDPLTF